MRCATREVRDVTRAVVRGRDRRRHSAASEEGELGCWVGVAGCGCLGE